MRADALTRFEDKVSIEPNSGCWLWTGALYGKGYGAFWFEGKLGGAHRASYQLHVGLIPEGMHVCHRCDNPPCVNPQHLFLGTNQDNIDDMDQKGRRRLAAHVAANAAKTHCPKGCPFAGDNLRTCKQTGKRKCKACGAQSVREYQARLKAAMEMYR